MSRSSRGMSQTWIAVMMSIQTIGTLGGVYLIGEYQAERARIALQQQKPLPPSQMNAPPSLTGPVIEEAIVRAGMRFATMSENTYSSEPNIRMEQLLNESEDLRQIGYEWRRVWFEDNPEIPTHIHGGTDVETDDAPTENEAP